MKVGHCRRPWDIFGRRVAPVLPQGARPGRQPTPPLVSQCCVDCLSRARSERIFVLLRDEATAGRQVWSRRWLHQGRPAVLRGQERRVAILWGRNSQGSSAPHTGSDPPLVGGSAAGRVTVTARGHGGWTRAAPKATSGPGCWAIGPRPWLHVEGRTDMGALRLGRSGRRGAVLSKLLGAERHTPDLPRRAQWAPPKGVPSPRRVSAPRR